MIDKKIVEYVASLARVDISEEEKEFFLPQFSKILEYIDQLKKVDVQRVAPMRGALRQENVLREDEIIESPKEIRENILANAPLREGEYFKVPKVIE